MDHRKAQAQEETIRIHEIVRQKARRLRTLQLDPVGVSVTQDLSQSNGYRTKLYTLGSGG